VSASQLRSLAAGVSWSSRRRVQNRRSASRVASRPAWAAAVAGSVGSACWATAGAHDPDGHEVRFYTTEHHTEKPGDGVLRVADPRESAARREQQARSSGTPA
jgi:hypothetical protein